MKYVLDLSSTVVKYFWLPCYLLPFSFSRCIWVTRLASVFLCSGKKEFLECVAHIFYGTVCPSYHPIPTVSPHWRKHLKTPTPTDTSRLCRGRIIIYPVPSQRQTRSLSADRVQGRSYTCLSRKSFRRSTNTICFTARRRTPSTIFYKKASTIAWAAIICCSAEAPTSPKLRRKLINIPVRLSLFISM